MKKFNRALCLILVLAIALSLCACGSSTTDETPTEFKSKNGFSIVLPANYKEKNDNKAVTCYFEGANGIVTCIEEPKESLKTAVGEHDITLTRYAELVISANGLSTSPSTDSEKNTYFTYSKTVDEKDFFYYGVVKESDESFWLFNFVCFEDAKDEYLEKFPVWAASITF